MASGSAPLKAEAIREGNPRPQVSAPEVAFLRAVTIDLIQR